MKKIMFNEPYGLQQATFDGSKTMTRRVVPDVILNYVPIYQQQYYEATLSTISVEDAIMNMVGPEKMFQRYVYQVGEIVAIAQRYEQISGDRPPVMLLGELIDKEKGIYSVINSKETKGWSNKMFVKAEHMPHHIKIKSRRLEYLQSISDEDCLREGVRREHWGGEDHYTVGDYLLWDRIMRQRGFSTPRKAFEVLIRNISGDKAWYRNPLVFVYEYERID